MKPEHSTNGKFQLLPVSNAEQREVLNESLAAGSKAAWMAREAACPISRTIRLPI
jgi:hypothetical protein